RERHEGRAKTVKILRSGGAEALWEDMRPKVFSDHVDDAVAERAREIALSREPDELVAAVEPIRDRPDSTEAVASLEVPVVLAVGDQDPFFSIDEALPLADRYAHVRLQPFPNTG